ncbi:hypothetical protein [Aeromonas diversa]|uniref:Uncharacterized protein n=1 Tax=Aeromonas diversa CDC 2478-85 TaxID=1268237 RepID=N9VG16_9GAMM|nr:hypothetical protein [Aeromonas diversa]ENY70331.1 hypothetical protein G114_18899 [Aeromonas diversa CDC 2478-85]
MKWTLTEIGNASQFHEYLAILGIDASFEPHGQGWEYHRRNELVARVLIDPEGNHRYYLSARHLCQHH